MAPLGHNKLKVNSFNTASTSDGAGSNWEQISTTWWQSFWSFSKKRYTIFCEQWLYILFLPNYNRFIPLYPHSTRAAHSMRSERAPWYLFLLGNLWLFRMQLQRHGTWSPQNVAILHDKFPLCQLSKVTCMQSNGTLFVLWRRSLLSEGTLVHSDHNRARSINAYLVLHVIFMRPNRQIWTWSYKNPWHSDALISSK